MVNRSLLIGSLAAGLVLALVPLLLRGPGHSPASVVNPSSNLPASGTQGHDATFIPIVGNPAQTREAVAIVPHAVVPTSEPDQRRDWVAILLRSEGPIEWKKALKEVAKQSGAAGVESALRAWRASARPGIPSDNALALHQAIAEHFVGKRSDSHIHIRDHLLKVHLPKDVEISKGFPAIKFLAGGTNGGLLSEEGRRLLLAQPPTDPRVAAGEDPYHFWGGSPGIGELAAWKDYVQQLQSASIDMRDPVGALTACIWVHAIYMNNQLLFPNFLPPSAADFIRRNAGSSVAMGADDALAGAMEAGKSNSDIEAVLLEDEIKRWRALDPQYWSRHDAYGVWSLRVQLTRQFENYAFAEDALPEARRSFEALMDLAHRLVE